MLSNIIYLICIGYNSQIISGLFLFIAKGELFYYQNFVIFVEM